MLNTLWIWSKIAKAIKNKSGKSIGQTIGNLGSSLLNNVTGADLTGAQQAQNQFNADEAQKARDYQSSIYQTTVQDMTAAGLNPAYMYGNGNGAAGTTNAMANGGMPSQGATLGDLMEILFSQAKMENLQATTRNIEADTDKKNEETVGQAIQNKITDIQSKYTEQEIQQNLQKGEVNIEYTNAMIDLTHEDVEYKKKMEEQILQNIKESAQNIKESDQRIKESYSRISLNDVEKYVLAIEGALHQQEYDITEATKDSTISEAKSKAGYANADYIIKAADALFVAQNGINPPSGALKSTLMTMSKWRMDFKSRKDDGSLSTGNYPSSTEQLSEFTKLLRP